MCTYYLPTTYRRRTHWIRAAGRFSVGVLQCREVTALHLERRRRRARGRARRPARVGGGVGARRVDSDRVQPMAAEEQQLKGARRVAARGGREQQPRPVVGDEPRAAQLPLADELVRRERARPAVRVRGRARRLSAHRRT